MDRYAWGRHGMACHMSWNGMHGDVMVWHVMFLFPNPLAQRRGVDRKANKEDPIVFANPRVLGPEKKFAIAPLNRRKARDVRTVQKYEEKRDSCVPYPARKGPPGARRKNAIADP